MMKMVMVMMIDEEEDDDISGDSDVWRCGIQ